MHCKKSVRILHADANFYSVFWGSSVVSGTSDRGISTTATETQPAATSTGDGFDSVVDDLESTGKDIVTGAGDAVKDAKDMITNP